MNNTIIKRVPYSKSKQINIYSGYTYILGLHREILCIKLLYNSYTNCSCICKNQLGKNICHFPSLIDVKINNKCGYIKMTNQGIDVQQLIKKKIKLNNILNIESINTQINCILNTLNYCNIIHLDLNDNGKNICINKHGHISLIDFDIMYMTKIDNNNTLTPLMLNRINRFKYTNFKDKLYKILIKII